MPAQIISRPLIGLTTYRDLNQYGFNQFSLAEAYTEALVSAGACPVLIPLGLPETTIGDLTSHLDGVMFTGGGDIHPETYGSESNPLVSDVDNDRDRLELYLLKEALHLELPILGICRGLQLINVGLGGSLYEDILDQRPGALKHQYFPDWPRDHLAHSIRIEGGSGLGEILGAPELMVNSLHHQGIKDLAERLMPVAFAPDGMIEGFEISDYTFGMAVQWHPEWMQEHPPMQALFHAFVQAASRYNNKS